MAKGRKHTRDKQENDEKPHSWAAVRSLFTCKYLQVQQQQQQQLHKQKEQKLKQPQSVIPKGKKQIKDDKKEKPSEESNNKCKKMKCSGSLCSNTKITHKPEISATPHEEQHKINKRAGHTVSSLMPSSYESDASSRSRKTGATLSVVSSSSTSSFSAAASAPPSTYVSFRSMPFRKLSGCYECRMVVDPILGMTRDPSLRNTICSCPECGEIFMKPETLELHQAVRHAVCELGGEDTSKNIVEIIFQSSWLKKEAPVCKIERILKVQNTPKSISKFEEYRESIKAKATKLPKKQPRCVADGNELLRFHCTTFTCSLGLNASSNLCNSIPTCSVCSIIKNGFRVGSEGILTTATSGKAHDRCGGAGAEGRRAMLVCRVIAGRVKKNPEGDLEDYDSVAGAAGVYSNLEELHVFNPKAILPCFVVIYGGF